MKFFIYSIIILSLVLIGYNIMILDFDALMQGDSATALIAIVASFCVLVLMVILLISRKIDKKYRS